MKIKTRNKRLKDNGQTLVEVAVAISVLMLGILGAITLLNQALGLNKMVSSQYIASNLAMEGIEVVKNIIDANFMNGREFYSGIETGCYELSYDSQGLGIKVGGENCYNGAMDIEDTNGFTFLNFDSTTGIYSYSAGSPSKPGLKRKVRIELKETSPTRFDEIKVNSVVSWDVKGFKNVINLEDHFYNWR